MNADTLPQNVVFLLQAAQIASATPAINIVLTLFFTEVGHLYAVAVVEHRFSNVLNIASRPYK